MTDVTTPRDYSATLDLPKTSFPMRGNLPVREPEFLARWRELDLNALMRSRGAGRPSFVLHDGPPYANGHLHMGHALNKVLKDVLVRSARMRGFSSEFVSGWDCHGLPIESKVEEAYRAAGRTKEDVPTLEFRAECRRFAEHWVGVQSAEFERLGVAADFDRRYTTMDPKAEAAIARELMAFAASGQVVRGSKPVMWSVAERTALAEAEVEYRDLTSPAAWFSFPVRLADEPDLAGAGVVAWTTTPWTVPANRAVAFGPEVAYGLYQVSGADGTPEHFLVADAAAERTFPDAGNDLRRLRGVGADELSRVILDHPLRGYADGYEFAVPMLPGAHVGDDVGSGFVHTAPSHGREDYDVWVEACDWLEAEGYDTEVPFTLDGDGRLTAACPGFGPDRAEGAARVLDDEGRFGDADALVLAELQRCGTLLRSERVTRSYPHSWRSKRPVLFRNTPQWFVRMDAQLDDGSTLRGRALDALETTNFVPEAGRNRLTSMVASRPDWVLSRQRCWGVPLCLFVGADGEVLRDDAVDERVLSAFETEGSDAWFAEGARERFLGDRSDEPWEQVTDVLDVWFDSGATHSWVLDERGDGAPPADVYLEGSDQHRGWFQSSLLESCGTRNRAPYATVVTHGFTVSEDGRKMSKSDGNALSPERIVSAYGADVLRAWVVSSDYHADQRLGEGVVKAAADSYKKVRNTLRWLLGVLHHHDGLSLPHRDMPELERYMLHELARLDGVVRDAYERYDLHSVFRAVHEFAVSDLSAFWFEVRKDALYCDGPSSQRRRAALCVAAEILDRLTLWLAPMFPFLAEEAWLTRRPSDVSVHLETFRTTPEGWTDEALAEKWRRVRSVRGAVHRAVEAARATENFRSPLETAVEVRVGDHETLAALGGVDMAEVCVVSGFACYASDESGAVDVVVRKAPGAKCERSWRWTTDVGSDTEHPTLSARDAAVVREKST